MRIARNSLLVGLAGLVDGDDVGVVEGGLQQALAPEALAEGGIGAELHGQHLQRHHALQRELGGAVDGAHAALSERAVDAVAGDGHRAVQRVHQITGRLRGWRESRAL